MGIQGKDRAAVSRARILRAAVDLVPVAERQWPTAEEVAKAAEVPRSVFFEHFADGEGCFLAALDESFEAAERLVARKVAGTCVWAARVAAGLEAFLETVEADPARARFCLIAAPAHGGAAAARFQEVRERACAQLREGRGVCDWGDELPSEQELFLVGAVLWLVERALRDDAVEDLLSMLPDMLHLLLPPYIGDAEGAMGGVEADLEAAA